MQWCTNRNGIEAFGVFAAPRSRSRYPEKIRRIKYYDSETEVEFVFLTNNFELTATEIAVLYKNRWQVELQVDKTAFKGKNLLGTYPKCCKNPTLLRHYRLLPGCNSRERAKIDRPIYELKISEAKFYKF